MDFIHCNKCYSRLQNNAIRISLTECGHLYCDRCLERIQQTKICSVCNKTSGNFMLLSKDMDAAIQQFFMPFEALLKKAFDVYSFQNQHRLRMMQFLYQKYTFAKKECINTHNTNKKLLKENQMLKDKLSSPGSGPSNLPFVTSTPLSHNASNIDTMSTSSKNSAYACMFTPQLRPGMAQRIVNSAGANRRMVPNQRHIYSSGSSLDPSPVHRVPVSQNVAHVHHNPSNNHGTATSFQQLGGGVKRR